MTTASEIDIDRIQPALDALKNVPTGLRKINHWMPRTGKEPISKFGEKTGWTTPRNWITFDEAVEAYKNGLSRGPTSPLFFDGIEFIISREDDLGDKQLIGIDLDQCRDPITGQPSEWAKDKLDKLNSYTEVTPSSAGYHIWVYGELPNGFDAMSSEGMSPEAIQPEMWKHIKQVKPTAERCNCLEVYAGRRPFTVTGDRVEGYPHDLEHRQNELLAILTEAKAAGEYNKNSTDGSKKIGKTKGSLPHLDITKVIDTSGWERTGGQLRGPHPTLGSSTGHNLVVNPSTGQWAFMHNDLKKGGDAWTWLACECGAVSWEKAGSGALRDPTVLEKTKKHAVARGLFSKGELFESPCARLVSINDPVGSVGLDSDGTLKKIVLEKTKDGEQKALKWIADGAVYISTQTIADGETEFTFCGYGSRDKTKVCFTMPASDMAEPRKFKAALINAFGARNSVGDLDFETVQRISRNTCRMRRIEAPEWVDGVPLLPGVGLADDVEYKFSSMTPAAVYDGDLSKAKECLRKLLGLHKYAPILVATILGAPAFARWHSNDRFGLALWGLTGTLKTSIAQAALSVYGTGYMDDSALLKSGKASATQVATLEIFANAGILPQILDNVKTVDARDIQQYVSTIQAVIEGREKQRGKKDGGLRNSKTFACTPIITGEIRPEEASTTARILNITWTRPEDLSGLSYIQGNVEAMAVIGYHWLRFLAETNLNLVDGFSEARGRKMAEFSAKRFTNPGRLATIYMLLRATWGLLCESPLGDVFKEVTEGFIAALDHAIEEQGVTVTQETEVEKLLRGVTALIASKPHLVQNKDGVVVGGIPSHEQIIGRMTNEGLFLIPERTLEELAKMKVFTQQPSVDSLTKALRADGKLIPSKDGKHSQVQIRVNGQRPRGWLLPASVLEGVSTQDEGCLHRVEAAKTLSEGPVASLAPLSPAKMRENFSEKNSQDFRRKREIDEFGGDSGDRGDKDSSSVVVDRLVDGDFSSKVGVSTSVSTPVTTQPGSGDSPSIEALAGPKRICAVCGKDLTDNSYVEKDGEFFCPVPGCFYSKRSGADSMKAPGPTGPVPEEYTPVGATGPMGPNGGCTA